MVFYIPTVGAVVLLTKQFVRFGPQHQLFQQSPALITNMKAVIIKEAGKAEMADVKEQSMRAKYFKVKTVAVALNPSNT